MGVNYVCPECGKPVGMNGLTSMSGGICAQCALGHQQLQMQAAAAMQAQAKPIEKEVFGDTIREQLAIDNDADSKGEKV